MNARHPLKAKHAQQAFWAVLGGLFMCVALAQSPLRPQPQPEPGAPVLKPSSLLPLLLPPQNRARQPLFIQADHLSGRPDLDLLMLGDVQLRRADTLIRAERIDYFQPTDAARARGNVRINQAGNVFEGPDLDLKIEAFEGSITEPSYQLLRSQGHGKARRVDFLGEKRAVIHQGDYTTCRRKPGPSWLPDWLIRADRLSLDSEKGDAEVTNGALYFKDTAVVACCRPPSRPITSMASLTLNRTTGTLRPIGIC